MYKVTASSLEINWAKSYTCEQGKSKQPAWLNGLGRQWAHEGELVKSIRLGSGLDLQTHYTSIHLSLSGRLVIVNPLVPKPFLRYKVFSRNSRGELRVMEIGSIVA